MNGYEQEIIIPVEYVVSTMVPGAEHEAGHIIAAHHLNAHVVGIAVGFRSDKSRRGMFLQSIYGWKDSTVEAKCVVKAAGPAADILYHGLIDPQDASEDLRDIEILTGQATMEPFLETAKSIISRYTVEFRCITDAFRHSLELEVDRTLGYLPNNDIGALLLDEAQLMGCLSKNPNQSS